MVSPRVLIIEFFQPLPKKTAPAQKSSTSVASTEEASDALNRIVVEAALSVHGSVYDRETEILENGSTTNDSGYGDDPEFYSMLDKTGGDCSDDEEDAINFDDNDDVINDCGPLYNNITGNFRVPDDELRRFAMLQPLCELAQAECPKGNRGHCAYGGACCGKMEVREIWELRKNFWCFEDVRAPTSTERNKKITDMLKLFLDLDTLKFNYSLLKANGKRVKVCEKAFLVLLGYRAISGQWNRCKTKVRGLQRLDSGDEVKHRQPRSKPRFEAARAWIKLYCDKQSELLIHQAELRREGDFVDVDQVTVKIKSIPYESLKTFYEHYREQVPEQENRCGRSCFDRAFDSFSVTSLKKEGYVGRMRRCKHSFSTCDICNNGDALLKDKNRQFSQGQREILRAYIKTHLDIQDAEREEERTAICKAREVDARGQPKQAFMLFDGFSIFKGVTPKWSRGVYGGKSHTEKEEPKVENRVIAGIVICGHIDSVFVYTVDQLTSGGANLMIEVIRQALSDLGKLLIRKGKKLSRILYLQFDNCGENKNKYMMSFCSMLVESGR